SPMWSGRASTIKKEGAAVDFTFNEGILGVDCMVIPRGAPNKELAEKAINSFLKPENQAKVPALIDYGPVNEKAFETGMISEEAMNAINSSPENASRQILADDIWWGDHRADLQTRWDEFLQR